MPGIGIAVEGPAAITRQLRLALVPVFLGLAVLVGVIAFGARTGQPDSSPGPSGSAPTSVAAATPGPAGAPTATSGPVNGPTPSEPAASGSPEPSLPPATPSPTPTPRSGRIAIVPVVGFWSGETAISMQELILALKGRSTRFPSVVVAGDEAPGIAAAFGLGPQVTLTGGTPDKIRRQVRRGALGLLRLDDVTPQVRALSLDGLSLFGNERITDLGSWPLTVADGRTDGLSWEQSAVWTLAAGGDIQLDRLMAYQVTSLGKGVDFPYDGGSVRITDRTCCSLGQPLPVWERTGSAGAVRRLFGDADLAIANLESAAVRDPALHRLGPGFIYSLSFSGDPRLLRGPRNAGFDFLSLANNHIRNAGAAGISDTRDALDELGIAHAGAGTDLAEASQLQPLEAAGQTVMLLPCTTVGVKARPGHAGARPCQDPGLLEQIAAAETDVVIVFPHWGREYTAVPLPRMRQLAQAWVDAGADLVLGSHSHWAGAVEVIDDKLVFYSMGNLAFDQPWSEATREGLIVELTFQGDRLVQAWLHPTLIVADVQPNVLEYEWGGDRVLTRMREASAGLLPY